MKTILASAFIAFAATFSVPGMAADHASHGAMPVQTQQSTADVQMTDGQVKKVDKAAGKVTLSHGPIANIGMTMPMTMVFRVKESAWLDQMKEGDKIRFMADKINGAITVVHFEAVK